MITIKIAEDERRLNEVDEQWINQQINRRIENGLPVCVRVTIQDKNIDMVLSTPNCQSNGDGGRSPNPKEREILTLWNQRELNRSNFSGGNLIAFLRQLERLL